MTGATYQIVVVEGFIVFLLNLSPRGCWRAVGTQCEPVCSECEPAHSDSVTECEPGKGDVCKPACGYLRAATTTSRVSRPPSRFRHPTRREPYTSGRHW